MADLTEEQQWKAGIYQLETEDPVLGGENGIDNQQAKQLGARTLWLRGLIETVCTAQGVSLDNTELTQFLTALDARYASNDDITAAVAAVIDSSPAALDTLNELAAALGDDANFAATINNELALKAPIDSAGLTGAPTSTTAPLGDVSQRIATMAALDAAIKGVQTDYTARFTTTANVNLTGLATQAGGDWADALTAGDIDTAADIIMAKDQTTASENGWYVAAADAWARLDNANADGEIKPSCLTRVSEGATLADTLWILTTDAPIVVGSSDLTFVQQGVAQQLAARIGFTNLKSNATGVDANVAITADEAVLKNAEGDYITVNDVDVTVDTSTVGVNGLDTGTLTADTWYSVWAIYDGTTVAATISLAETAPTLSGGYTHYARCGWIKTDSSVNMHPLAYTQRGAKVAPLIVSSGNMTGFKVLSSGAQGVALTPVYVEIGVAAFVPPTATSIRLTLPYHGATVLYGLAPNGNYAAYNSTVAPPPVSSAGHSAELSVAVTIEMLLESMNVYFATNKSSLLLTGWTDNL